MTTPAKTPDSFCTLAAGVTSEIFKRDVSKQTRGCRADSDALRAQSAACVLLSGLSASSLHLMKPAFNCTDWDTRPKLRPGFLIHVRQTASACLDLVSVLTCDFICAITKINIQMLPKFCFYKCWKYKPTRGKLIFSPTVQQFLHQHQADEKYKKHDLHWWSAGTLFSFRLLLMGTDGLTRRLNILQVFPHSSCSCWPFCVLVFLCNSSRWCICPVGVAQKQQ